MKIALRHDEKRELIKEVVQSYEPLSVRQACKMFNLSSSVYRYEAKRSPEDTHYCQVFTTLAEHQPTWGFSKMYSRLRLDAYTIPQTLISHLWHGQAYNGAQNT